jgi:hydrogenase nickel incorporation protein HypA/HybF
LSIAKSLADLILEEIEPGDKVTKVVLKLGILCGVEPPALHTAFEAVAVGTPFAEAELSMEIVPILIWCEECDCNRELEGIAPLRCPVCQSPASMIIQGRELELSSLELV